MISTPFYGNNLCNLLSNKIIKEFDIIDNNHITSINVVDLNNFIVLVGYTTISTSLNFSSIFVNYINEISDINRNFNVIDLIKYGKNKVSEEVTFSKSLDSNEIYNDFFNVIELKKQGFIDIKNNLNSLYTNNLNLLSEYDNKKSLNIYEIFSDNFFYSDLFFGSSLTLNKIYSIYFKYISYHLFEANTCKDIYFNLTINKNYKDINNENIILDVYSNTNIVSHNWIKSLILDLFDFNPVYIKKHLSLEEYNFENEILSEDKCWKKKDKISDIILI